MPSLEPENERAVITREQQSDLDPILGEAMVLGLGLAVMCGIFSSGMSFAMDAAQPIQQAALRVGVSPLYSALPAYVFIMGGGAIVNLASVRSVVAGGGNLLYDTTKAAIAGLTRGLAADHSAEGIRVNAVGPGPIFTPFHARRIAAAGETVEQYNAKAAQGTMMKRPGRAEEVAAAILFLASDDASYVTGALLFVDGGMTAM